MLLGELLREFIGVSVATFIDDICIFTRSWEEHEDILRKVLKILQDNHLKVALKKCVFGRKELKFLGHIIGRDGIKRHRFDVILRARGALSNRPPLTRSRRR